MTLVGSQKTATYCGLVTDATWGDAMNNLEKTLNRADHIAAKLWRYGWGLLFVVAMTLFSEMNPALSGSPALPARTTLASASTIAAK